MLVCLPTYLDTCMDPCKPILVNNANLFFLFPNKFQRLLFVAVCLTSHLPSCLHVCMPTYLPIWMHGSMWVGSPLTNMYLVWTMQISSSFGALNNFCLIEEGMWYTQQKKKLAKSPYITSSPLLYTPPPPLLTNSRTNLFHTYLATYMLITTSSVAIYRYIYNSAFVQIWFIFPLKGLWMWRSCKGVRQNRWSICMLKKATSNNFCSSIEATWQTQ